MRQPRILAENVLYGEVGRFPADTDALGHGRSARYARPPLRPSMACATAASMPLLREVTVAHSPAIVHARRACRRQPARAGILPMVGDGFHAVAAVGFAAGNQSVVPCGGRRARSAAASCRRRQAARLRRRCFDQTCFAKSEFGYSFDPSSPRANIEIQSREP